MGGAAAIWAVALKAVHRFQQVATHRAREHHRQRVHHVDVQGVQLDEAPSKLRPKQVEWVHTALAMGSEFPPYIFDFWLRFRLIDLTSESPGTPGWARRADTVFLLRADEPVLQISALSSRLVPPRSDGI
jgi:hypothetical protein